MLDYQGIYHTGVRVAHLETAMDELGAGLGVSWCRIQEREQPVWLPGAGATTIPLRFTYSAEGPQHIELLEGAPGSIWDGREQPGVHHVGVWSDDVAGDTARLLGLGWRLLVAGKAPEEGYGGFTYVLPPSGMLVELVSSAAQPMFARWFAGGDLR
jgi:hypothetical protein